MDIPLQEPLLKLLYEDDHLLVVNKPADLVCHPTKTHCMSSLIARLRIHLGTCPLGQVSPYCIHIPGGTCPWHTTLMEPAPTVSLVNRLDRETSGIVLAAKDSDTARMLGNLMRSGKMQKMYQAIVQGIPNPPSGIIDQPLGDDEQSIVVVKDCVRQDGTPAQTVYRLVQTFEHEGKPYSLLNVFPHTGRKHQIRIHLAWIGCPIVGDKLYGDSEQYYLDLVEGRLTDAQRKELLLPYHALHARKLSFTTWEGKDWQFECEPEPWFLEFMGA